MSDINLIKNRLASLAPKNKKVGDINDSKEPVVEAFYRPPAKDEAVIKIVLAKIKEIARVAPKIDKDDISKYMNNTMISKDPSGNLKLLHENIHSAMSTLLYLAKNGGR